MKILEAVEVLKNHNEWRRDTEDKGLKMTNPIDLGIAIDTVVNFIETLNKKE